jgi:cytochrome c-type biogenesis protein
MAEGMFMLFVFSMGLGLPFIASAALMGHLKNTFAFIKRNYRVINIISGGLLILVGILIMTGMFGHFAAIFGGLV